MDEIEYKLESANPVLISHAVSKLFESIKRKKETDHISKIAEFKLLLTKRDSENVALSITACQALIALVENGLWDINEALSTFTSSISSIKNHMVATTAISHLLTFDLKRDAESKAIYPFTLHTPQHPFIIILTRDKRNWQTIVNEMRFIVNHRDNRINKNSIRMLRPVFLYVLCTPLESMACLAQQVWHLLIESNHGSRVQREVLLWMCTAEYHCCVNTNYRILELAERALADRNREHCTALLPMIASLIVHLLKQGSDPRVNFDAMIGLLDCCDPSVGNLTLTLMAEAIASCPAIYLYSALQLCVAITRRTTCSDTCLSIFTASLLKWIAYPSVLCADALDMARDLVNGNFRTSAEAKPASSSQTIFSNELFTIFADSDPYVRLYAELVHRSSAWKSGDTLSWLKNMRRAPIYLKDKCKLLIGGLLLQTNEPEVTELCCGILLDVSRERRGFASHALSLLLHKLTKCKSSAQSKQLLLAIPELAIAKENVPIITHAFDTLLNGDKQLKYFTIELYLKVLRREPRCYRFISAAIIRLMKTDCCWYSNATCARAMSVICETNPEHGEKLVPLLSQILNRSTDRNGGTATALALRCISALCRASVIDICSTWRVLAPKMQKEKRTIVLESLCQLFADVPSYPTIDSLEQYDQLIDSILSMLWNYTTYQDLKVADAAFKALASYRLEQHSLKRLPAEMKRNLTLPAQYAKTPIDAARNPEDVLPYIPAICWIQMLENARMTSLSAAGDLLISFVTEEVRGFRSGIYMWNQGEPKNFKYLAEKSAIRAVGEYLRKSDKSDPSKHRIVTECLRIFAHKYPKPLPNVDWSFLKDTIDISDEAKRHTISIACRQAAISLSAKSFIEDYLSMYKSANDAEFIWKTTECAALYSNLEDLCEAVQPNVVKPFLEATLKRAIEKMNLDNEDSIEFFDRVMRSYARTLRSPETHHANYTLISATLEKLLDEIDLTRDRFRAYFAAALELSPEYLERMTSPKMWWEVPANKLKNVIAIRAELAVKKPSDESPLTWLNETIDEAIASAYSVQTYLLEVVQKVQTETRLQWSGPSWILQLMTRIQALLAESSRDCNEKVQFYCDILFISVISLSGIDSALMERDLPAKSKDVATKLFPLALAILSDRQDWKHAIPQVMEWLNYMRTSAISSTHKSTFHRSLVSLRHSPYYRDVWTKYLSIELDMDANA